MAASAASTSACSCAFASSPSPQLQQRSSFSSTGRNSTSRRLSRQLSEVSRSTSRRLSRNSTGGLSGEASTACPQGGDGRPLQLRRNFSSVRRKALTKEDALEERVRERSSLLDCDSDFRADHRPSHRPSTARLPPHDRPMIV